MMDAGDRDSWWERSYAYARSHLEPAESDFQAEQRRRAEESAANKDFYAAVSAARETANADGILPVLGAPLTEYQGIKAACLAREDISTVMRVQLLLLEKLNRLHFLERTSLECSTVLLKAEARNRTMLWVIIALLAYIAVKVS